MKRTFDFLIAFVVFVALFPLLIVVYFLIFFKLGRPVLFKQLRPGINGRIFNMYKFRTMTDARDDRGELMPDEYRLTRFGLFLRSTSLDELPGLWNVIKGDMGLVGPRPLLMEYIPLYTSKQARRHEVKPGITGWAQVNGRNAISWDQKFELDVWYVENQSFWLDIKILFMTLLKVLKRQDISQEGHSTIEKFTGSPK